MNEHMVGTPENPRAQRKDSGDAAQRFEIPVTAEQLIVGAALFWTLSANRGFLGAAISGQTLPAGSAGAGLVAAFFVIALCAHVLLLGLLAGRHTAKPLIAILTVAAAAASHFMSTFGVVIDPTMLRNVLFTDPAEARELISAGLLLHLALYAGLPLLLLSRVRLVRRGALRSAAHRAGLLALAILLLAGATLAEFQPLASRMRNDRALRYRITPANLAWSLASVAGSEARGAARPREPIGLDAAQGASWRGRDKPLVLLVGETARAANWGLSGHARQTTPELARLPVVNFPEVVACGTNTEVSLPCMFAPVGRRDYDEERIRGQESLLHVLARAGASVHWRDNQSGCKGNCEGLPNDRVETSGFACEGDRCRTKGWCTTWMRDCALPRAPRSGCCTCSATTAPPTSAVTPRSSRAFFPSAAATTWPAARERRSSTPTTMPCSTPTICCRRRSPGCRQIRTRWIRRCCMCPTTASRWASTVCTCTARRIRSHPTCRPVCR
jgi:lipid A ethanolaminephosphotransferase